MENHILYGPSVPEKGWVPAPRFMLRRARIMHHLKDKKPGNLIEVGCGPATIIHELSQRKFQCTALETSPQALEIANYINSKNSFVKIYDTIQPNWEESFDYLHSFDVLEHIEDDAGALSQWHNWLKPDGIMLLSVPAHMSKWSPDDEWAGHFRRYEKTELIKSITDSGFTIDQFENYGFPLANIIDPIRTYVHRRQLKARQLDNKDSREHNNAHSGIERSAESKIYPFLRSLPGTLFMRFAFTLQNLFLKTDLGNGYLVVARKTQKNSN